jgi:hypothetical protein
MKLSKKTRTALRRRKLTKFRWSAFEPKQGRTYSLEGTGERIRIVAVVRDGDGYQVAALIVDDPVRLLPATVGDYEQEASSRVLRNGFEPELEAVDELTQRRITEDSRRRAQYEKTEANGELLAAMGDLRAAIDEMPEDRKRRISRTLWQLRSRLDSAEREMRRRLVA